METSGRTAGTVEQKQVEAFMQKMGTGLLRLGVAVVGAGVFFVVALILWGGGPGDGRGCALLADARDLGRTPPFRACDRVAPRDPDLPPAARRLPVSGRLRRGF
jgi:hypothetical protein